ncbi:hypothetical protein CIHG_08365 [Coccidioides immitis H538.4]|uniref:Uncharacterized protein n=3 Tax=Coccidioides immitis TaxID=5501 RepID=A0A0J8TTA5_COCIT|nr:hypothetical protein CIRG_06419 [Coccidioides immitis RMSCC 2394]KMU77032.1 hypothetical protein CISG_06267 [Coccidioides immitis RMSCC 3703]KMU90476.1 hypothetical protein CIHG_08365 [Coccidioides immitis H538.4]
MFDGNSLDSTRVSVLVQPRSSGEGSGKPSSSSMDYWFARCYRLNILIHDRFRTMPPYGHPLTKYGIDLRITSEKAAMSFLLVYPAFRRNVQVSDTAGEKRSIWLQVARRNQLVEKMVERTLTKQGPAAAKVAKQEAEERKGKNDASMREANNQKPQGGSKEEGKE